eukprot:6231611-Pyramimonas_sp.AAC.2
MWARLRAQRRDATESGRTSPQRRRLATSARRARVSPRQLAKAVPRAVRCGARLPPPSKRRSSAWFRRHPLLPLRHSRKVAASMPRRVANAWAGVPRSVARSVARSATTQSLEEASTKEAEGRRRADLSLPISAREALASSRFFPAADWPE